MGHGEGFFAGAGAVGFDEVGELFGFGAKEFVELGLAGPGRVVAEVVFDCGVAGDGSGSGDRGAHGWDYMEGANIVTPA